MIVIYTQENTIIKNDADTAKGELINLYGEKLGVEAYVAVKGGKIGATYRRYGGPLVKVVSKRDAAIIREREYKIGMLKG